MSGTAPGTACGEPSVASLSAGWGSSIPAPATAPSDAAFSAGYPFQRPYETRHVVGPPRIPQFDRVTPGELHEIFRQITRRRHGGALNEHRNDARALPLEGGPDLDPHEVLRILQPKSAPFVGGIEPARADHGKQDISSGYRLRHDLVEIKPRLDPVHIHEDVLAKPPDKRVVQSPRLPSGVITPVIEEDPKRVLSTARVRGRLFRTGTNRHILSISESAGKGWDGVSYFEWAVTGAASPLDRR